jgi:hypothetical protein
MVRVSLPKITPITVICDKSGAWARRCKTASKQHVRQGEHQGLQYIGAGCQLIRALPGAIRNVNLRLAAQGLKWHRFKEFDLRYGRG